MRGENSTYPFGGWYSHYKWILHFIEVLSIGPGFIANYLHPSRAEDLRKWEFVGS